jgi:hypothetical protein
MPAAMCYLSALQLILLAPPKNTWFLSPVRTGHRKGIAVADTNPPATIPGSRVAERVPAPLQHGSSPSSRASYIVNGMCPGQGPNPHGDAGTLREAVRETVREIARTRALGNMITSGRLLGIL